LLLHNREPWRSLDARMLAVAATADRHLQGSFAFFTFSFVSGHGAGRPWMTVVVKHIA